jgi:hypothetical protein
MSDEALASEGGCQCGAVRYLAHRQGGSMICHCKTCRAISGSLAVGWVSFESAGFQFTKGAPRRFHSSAPIERTFCGDCGTPLTYQPIDSKEYIDVATGTLDHPERFPPTHHSWLSHNVPWVKFGDGLPEFPQGRYDD